MTVPALLRELLSAAGPSGSEEPAARVWREAASAFAEVHGDTLGTSFARVGGSALAARSRWSATSTRSASRSRRSRESGLLSFSTLGGFDAEVLAGQRVVIAGRNGPVEGVVAPRSRSRRERADRTGLRHDDLHVDIGAASAEEARRTRRPRRRGGLARGAARAAEQPDRLPRARQPPRRLRSARGRPPDRRGGKAGERRRRRLRPGGDRPRRRPHGGVRARTRRRARARRHLGDRCAGREARAAPGRSSSARVLRSRAGRSSTGMSRSCCCARPRRTGSRTLSRCTPGRRTPTPTTCMPRARASRPESSRFPSATCTRPCELASLDDLEAVVALVVAFARRLTSDTSFVR